MPTTGKITQVIGSTFDAKFPEDQLPEIYNALTIDSSDHGATMHLVGEVQQHLGGGRVRAAKSVEGQPVDLSGGIAAAVHAAAAAEPREAYADSHKAFAAFMDGRPAITV